MTSEHTKEPTLDFFRQRNYFGLEEENLIVFEQGMLPCFTFDGKIIMETKSQMAKSPGKSIFLKIFRSLIGKIGGYSDILWNNCKVSSAYEFSRTFLKTNLKKYQIYNGIDSSWMRYNTELMNKQELLLFDRRQWRTVPCVERSSYTGRYGEARGRVRSRLLCG